MAMFLLMWHETLVLLLTAASSSGKSWKSLGSFKYNHVIRFQPSILRHERWRPTSQQCTHAALGKGDDGTYQRKKACSTYAGYRWTCDPMIIFPALCLLGLGCLIACRHTLRRTIRREFFLSLSIWFSSFVHVRTCSIMDFRAMLANFFFLLPFDQAKALSSI